METHTKTQIIKQNGVPAFAVLPWDEYQKIIKNSSRPNNNSNWWGDDTPHEVVVDVFSNNKSKIKAWREFLHLTQQSVADSAGIKQASLARIENSNSKPHLDTLKKIAYAMGISLSQLEE
ncbi:hypothetical protein BHECKSOX_1902 [Bathymodiolus heckerae thiotrophic gill symbiont]|uniref:helix-turn-helix domain-containing protein n=1 Tax=Bathymodiolus heckerae thiotrophic gill symbiont TaxID=1052212 RepID=UPI0010B35921|nr:helix-turn-helix transcriptional regulator [Bathymodiolus heckerae thiotrophic gill symbiont]SHN92948.1 hypothetical protein BHECKSOX_1902 [Bathymodiolus heckerae thiotrophic gill symbiont]